MFRALSTIAVVSFFSITLPTDGFAQPQSKDQQSCINGLNKAGAKVAATQGKESAACVKNAGKGSEPNAQACLTLDPKQKISKAAAKTTAADAKCSEDPDFGDAAPSQINGAATGQELALTADVFGADLTAAIILAMSDKTGAGCQSAIIKAYEKLASTKVKSFLKCKKDGLAGKSGPPFASAGDLAGCITAIASDAKVTKSAAKLASTVTTKCPGVVLDTAFPGDCVGAGNFATCVDEHVECRVCLFLDAMDNLTLDCDLFDNGLADSSCANTPTTTTTTSTTTTTTTSTTTSTTLPPGADWGMSCFASADCASFCASTGCQCDAFLSSVAVPLPSAMCFFDCMDLGGTVTSCRSACGGPPSAPPCDTTVAGGGGFTGVVTGAGKCTPSGFAASVGLGGTAGELKRILVDFTTPIDELSLFPSPPSPCSGACPTPGSACDAGAPYPVVPSDDVFRLQMGAAAPPPEVCDRLGVATTVCKYSPTGYAFILASPICTTVPIDVTMFMSCHVSAGGGASFLHFATGDFFTTGSWPP